MEKYVDSNSLIFSYDSDSNTTVSSDASTRRYINTDNATASLVWEPSRNPVSQVPGMLLSEPYVCLAQRMKQRRSSL